MIWSARLTRASQNRWNLYLDSSLSFYPSFPRSDWVFCLGYIRIFLSFVTLRRWRAIQLNLMYLVNIFSMCSSWRCNPAQATAWGYLWMICVMGTWTWMPSRKGENLVNQSCWVRHICLNAVQNWELWNLWIDINCRSVCTVWVSF